MTEPKTLDGVASAAHLRDRGTVTPGTCLNAVWRAFGAPRSTNGDDYRGYEWAVDALEAARDAGALRTGNLEDAPPGAVLYWTNVIGIWTRRGVPTWGDAGHIAIVTADRRIATIDLPTRGRTGAVTPAEFRRAWGHLRFAGWAIGPGAFLGHTVTGAHSEAPAGKPATPSQPTPAAPSAPIPSRKDRDMLTIKNKNQTSGDFRGIHLSVVPGQRFARHHTDAKVADVIAAQTGGYTFVNGDTEFQNLMLSIGFTAGDLANLPGRLKGGKAYRRGGATRAGKAE